MPHFVIVTLFVLLLVNLVCWLLVYRQLDPLNRSAHPLYKLHQVLIALLALLIILLAVLVVLSSEPGDPQSHLYWP